MTTLRVLVAQDDVDHARGIAAFLGRTGCVCSVVSTSAAAVRTVTDGACDVVVADVRVDQGSDFELLQRLHTVVPAMPVIILTARGNVPSAVRAMKLGAYQYLVEPCSHGDLYQHVCGAVAHKPATNAPSSAAPFDSLVQSSARMKQLMQAIERVARSSAPVLIVGESGTGKELVARAIHDRGPRAARPFVAVNTTALPEHLLESELFGHVRGAYTGASRTRSGLFLEADGGTLLLDEIGDMSRTLQPKLLRVLQCGELRAVGSDQTRKVNVRVIAATHRDLARSVEAGQFREDLYYRLNALTLRVPALRERPEDIAALMPPLLAAARLRNPESPVTKLSEDVVLALQQRRWAGNVRELQSAVERLVVHGEEPVVSLQDLHALEAVTQSAVPHPWPQLDAGTATMRQMCERYVDWTLEQTGGNKAIAAARLGIDVSTLYRRQRTKG